MIFEKEQNEMYWYNYVTSKYEYRETPSDFTNYIPQQPAAISLYNLLIEHKGMTPVGAALQVLKACVGDAD